MTPPRTTVKRFIVALGLSILAHLALTFSPAIPLPEYRPSPVLEATLKTLPPPVAVKAPKSRPRPATRKQPATSQESSSPPGTVATPQAPPPEPALDGPAPALAQQPAPPEVEQEPPILLPELAEISYTIYKGRDGFAVGRAEHTWKRDGKRYTITQVAEASGIFSLIASGRHVQISQGEVTPAGLRPVSYWVQRGQSADKTDSAQFDWQSMRLTFGSGGDTRSVKLPAGTQDLLSFLYQLAFDPPQQSGSTQLYITNGRKLDNYGYQSLNEEILETSLGQIKTLHIGKLHQEGEENTEIWLATEYHYLPVKIRHTDKQGGVIEQTASAIKVQ